MHDMSWWSSVKAPSPRPSSDGGFEAPSRTDRAKCWAARDAFFACLDKHGIIDSIQEREAAGKACGGPETTLKSECASSWVNVTDYHSF